MHYLVSAPDSTSNKHFPCGLQKELDLRFPLPLNAWLLQTHTHPISGPSKPPMEIGNLTGDFLEMISGAVGPDGEPLGEDVDVWELASKLPADALEARINETRKKGPVLKKLYARLHFELEYPLNEKQAKKIKVTPHKPKPTAEEGVPDMPAEPEPELEPEPEPNAEAEGEPEPR